MLAAFAWLRDLSTDPAAVEAALWWHDAVYDPRAPHGENERASAALAAAAGCSDEVVRLVELTAGHVVGPDDLDGAVVADCDLSILAAAPDRYDRYAADVRAEYAHVDDATWRTGRAAVLQGFLAQDRLFVTDRAHERWDRPARDNLRRELDALL